MYHKYVQKEQETSKSKPWAKIYENLQVAVQLSSIIYKNLYYRPFSTKLLITATKCAWNTLPLLIACVLSRTVWFFFLSFFLFFCCCENWQRRVTFSTALRVMGAVEPVDRPLRRSGALRSKRITFQNRASLWSYTGGGSVSEQNVAKNWSWRHDLRQSEGTVPNLPVLRFSSCVNIGAGHRDLQTRRYGIININFCALSCLFLCLFIYFSNSSVWWGSLDSMQLT